MQQEPPSLHSNRTKTDNGCVGQVNEKSLGTGAGNVTPGHIFLPLCLTVKLWGVSKSVIPIVGTQVLLKRKNKEK